VLRDLDLPIGPVEEFPGEGTREVYVGADGQAARILLLQPLGTEGPYARALAKRGPGLHHLAFHVPCVKAFAAERPGWLMLPQSLETYKACKTVWLARPGVGTLVEVHEGEADYEVHGLVERVEVVGQSLELASSILSGLSGETIVVATESNPTVTVGGNVVPIQRFFGK
jgi:hypothetical protein